MRAVRPRRGCGRDEIPEPDVEHLAHQIRPVHRDLLDPFPPCAGTAAGQASHGYSRHEPRRVVRDELPVVTDRVASRPVLPQPQISQPDGGGQGEGERLRQRRQRPPECTLTVSVAAPRQDGSREGREPRVLEEIPGESPHAAEIQEHEDRGHGGGLDVDGDGKRDQRDQGEREIDIEHGLGRPRVVKRHMIGHPARQHTPGRRRVESLVRQDGRPFALGQDALQRGHVPDEGAPTRRRKAVPWAGRDVVAPDDRIAREVSDLGAGVPDARALEIGGQHARIETCVVQLREVFGAQIVVKDAPRVGFPVRLRDRLSQRATIRERKAREREEHEGGARDGPGSCGSPGKGLPEQQANADDRDERGLERHGRHSSASSRFEI